MKRTVLVATLIAATIETGCSLTMATVPKDWDGRTEPDCTDSMTPVLFDAGAALVASGVGYAAALNEEVELGIAGLVLFVTFTATAYLGTTRKRECSRERGQWRIRMEKEMAAANAPPPGPAGGVGAPRGFYCAASPASPAAGFCTREKADCQRARDAAAPAVPDLSACWLLETAACHLAGGLEYCAPTLASCEARARATPGASGCLERQ
jgi:hypothetical protein